MHYPDSPSCPHPLDTALAVTMAATLDEKLVITGYAIRHAPMAGTGVREMWLRTFDRHGGKIPPADWRTSGLIVLDEIDGQPKRSPFNGRPKADPDSPFNGRPKKANPDTAA